MEPAELANMVVGIRRVEAALGEGHKEPAASEAATAAVVRKSLVAASSIPAGTVLTEELIAITRPGTGLPPVLRPHLVGRTARVLIPRGTVIGLEMLS
jgi:sialic acid synthase SpsE